MLPLVAAAYKDGPVANMTGGFGEPSCHECHLDNPLNAPGGGLSIGGVPAAYAPGQSYEVTVDLTREGMARGGFEIAARFASGDRKGQQAGGWRTLDERVQIVRSETDPTLLFAEHNAAGSSLRTPGHGTWTLEWTAPDDGRAPVEFSAAANAANDDASPLGDYIYVSAIESAPPLR